MEKGRVVGGLGGVGWRDGWWAGVRLGGWAHARRQRGSTREATAGVEQLSPFSWQTRVQSDPVMAANWLKQRRFAVRELSVGPRFSPR